MIVTKMPLMEDATTQTDDHRQESLLSTTKTADVMSFSTLMSRLELQSQIQQELLQFLSLQRPPAAEASATSLPSIEDRKTTGSKYY